MRRKAVGEMEGIRYRLYISSIRYCTESHTVLLVYLPMPYSKPHLKAKNPVKKKNLRRPVLPGVEPLMAARALLRCQGDKVESLGL